MLLNRSLYGLREDLKIWYTLLSEELTSIGISEIKSAPCLLEMPDTIFLCYVDKFFILADTE